MKQNKTFIYILASIVIIFLLIALYGFYEKERQIQLYEDFRANKRLICGETVVQKSRGWTIKNNRFFTNGKLIKTIVFCKSAD